MMIKTWLNIFVILFKYPPLFTIEKKSYPDGSSNDTFGGLAYEATEAQAQQRKMT